MDQVAPDRLMRPSAQRRADIRSYAALISSSFVSNGGNAFANLAIPLYVLETTGSAAQTGVVAVVNFVPPFITSIFGGALVDRVGRKRMLLISEGFSFIGTAMIPLLHALGVLSFPLLLVLVALGAILDSPGRAARGAMVPTFANRAGFSPERAQVINQSGFFMAQTFGPALAGIVIGIWGPTAALWVNAGSFVASFLIVAFLVDNPQFDRKGVKTTYRQDLAEGFRYVWHDPFLRGIVLVVTYLTMFYVPLFSVVYPVLFTEKLNSTRALGLFVGLETAGTFVGSALYGWWGPRVSRWKVFIGAQLACMPFFWAVVLVPPIPILLACAFLNGFFQAPLNAVVQVALQVRTPDVMRPRVNSLVSAGALAAVPLGALAIGGMIEATGVLWAYAFVAFFYSVGPVLLAFIPVFRQIDNDLPEAMT
jgi:MFS family permease